MEICPRHHVSFERGTYCPGCVASVALSENEDDEETPFATLGDYELVTEIGRGGMGVVYLARQKGLNRRVALKLLPSGSLAGQEFIRRFRREGELAASLQHPNIVRIFEAGEAEGELFYSMELITGGSLADWRDGKSQRPTAAAELVRTLALAVEHAHLHGILHRDLKPANVLIDEQGHPKVADFGLARAVDPGGDLTLATHSFGSPAYMAPELVRDPTAATTLSDVYSLGAILYFLLSGRSPFVSASIEELLRQVRECEPAPPRILDPSIPKDLQKICLKSLDKIPGKRYSSAAKMAEDLERFTRGMPVLARPAGPAMKIWRLSRRAPWLSAAVACLILALMGGVAGIAWQSRIANERADETARTAQRLRLNLYASDISSASVALQRGETPLVNEILSRWENLPAGDDPRGFEWELLKQEARPAPNRLIEDRDATVTGIAISADGRELAVADQSGRILVRETEGKTEARTPPFPADEVSAIPAGLGGGWVLGGPDGDVRWVDREFKILRVAKGRQFSLARDVPLAIVGEVPRFHWWIKGGNIAVIDWRTGLVVREIPGDWRQAVLSPDGKTAALAGATGGLQLLDIASGKSRSLSTPSPVWALSFNSDGSKLAAGSRRSAIIWYVDAESAAPLVLPHPLTVWSTAFSPDGTGFLTASSDRRVRVWRMDDMLVPPLMLTGHASEIWCAAFTPDGTGVMAGGKDGGVLAWQLPSRGPMGADLTHDHSNAPFFSPDGLHLVTSRNQRSVVRELKKGTEILLEPGIQALGFSSDGSQIRICDGSGTTGNVAVANPEDVVFHPPSKAESGLRYRCVADGRWIVRVERDGMVNLLDPSTGNIVHRLKGPVPGMRHVVAGSTDGGMIAIAGDGDRSVVLHEVATGKAMRLEPASAYYFVSAAFSRDGSLLAAGDLSGPVQIWDTRSGKVVASLPGHPEETSAVAFSPDGRTLASMGHHQDLKLWQTATWRELFSTNLTEAAYSLVFAPDGKHLLATVGRLKNERIRIFPSNERKED